MMKNLLFIFLLMTGTFAIKAQVTFSDTVRLVVTSSDTDDVVIRLPINNATNNSVNINWKRTINDFDANWLGTQVCDFNTCYRDTVSSGPFLAPSVVPANSSNPFLLHFLTNRRTGTAHMQLAIYTPGHDSIPTLRYTDLFLTVNNTTAIKQIDAESIKVYPNPAKDFIVIQNQQGAQLSRVEVYSMLGRKVISEKLSSSEALTKIDLSEMQKGIYMVRVFDDVNNVVVTKSISHVR